MSLSESFTDLTGAPDTPGAAESPDSALPPVDPNLLRLREALDGVFDIAGEEHRENRRTKQRVYIFRGRLRKGTPQPPTRSAYDDIQQRFKPLGFTPMLQREHGEEVIVAIEGTLPMRQIQTRWWLHLILLLVTLGTTTIMGAALTGMPVSESWRALQAWDTTTLWSVLKDGLPFSLTLLAILGVHEMGHYVAARLHGVKVTLPFFIPLPVSGSLGTMGAVIFIRSPLMNRRALFDVGIAGPLAGLVVALPLYLVGLQAEPAIGLPQTWIQAGITRVANPPLLDAIAPLVVDTGNLDRFVFYRHPMALAAWFGVLLTALNLLPLGQFDGGHVAYALLGRSAWPLANLVFFLLLALGFFGLWFAWLIWAFMGLLTGLRHPPPHDDITPLGRVRTVIGIATAVIFALIFVPVPFYTP